MRENAAYNVLWGEKSGDRSAALSLQDDHVMVIHHSFRLIAHNLKSAGPVLPHIFLGVIGGLIPIGEKPFHYVRFEEKKPLLFERFPLSRRNR